MPRRSRRRDAVAPAAREERTQVFSRTKMCKFHILGMCTKGDQCHFAHSQDQMEHLPDLFRTKLCKTLINTGSCTEPDCRYAHNKEELRIVDGFNSNVNPSGVPCLDDVLNGDQILPAEQHHPVKTGIHNSPLKPAVKKATGGGAIGGQAHLVEGCPTMPAGAATAQNAAARQQIGVQPLNLQTMPGTAVPMLHGNALLPMNFMPVDMAQGQKLQAQAATLQQMGISMEMVTQMAMLQMGQAAQAQQQAAQAEAMRLQAQAVAAQAMAVACLQANAAQQAAQQMATGPATCTGGAVAGPMSAGGMPEAGMGMQNGINTSPGKADSLGGSNKMKPTVTNRGAPTQAFNVKNTFVTIDEGCDTPSRPLRNVHTYDGRLDLMPGAGSDSENEDGAMCRRTVTPPPGVRTPHGTTPRGEKSGSGGKATKRGGFPCEPMQINTGTLRSMSSNSLKSMDPLAEHEEADGAHAEANPYDILDDRLPHWKVSTKNTFIDVESTPVCGLRSVHSAAARLDAMGRDSCEGSRTPGSRQAGEDPLTPGHPLQRSKPSELALVPEEVDGCFSRMQSEEPATTTSTPPRDEEYVIQGQGACDLPTLPNYPHGWTVKNTFLDCGSEEVPTAALRSVHTYGGSLAQMAGGYQE
eukprot:TRINITY_DN1023_c0_g2_i1.p1 TRINITY_DN1023_c0_g2~~TRINITY_DN1023_c0_g2_i1.p1  ORF type:complete len:638 (-),score=141.87 TRINITY_DN1023_c0_g2_i1:199-2112(-)